MLKSYFVFLRAINVAGKNTLKMEACRDELTKKGFKNVKSYIQSGNFYLQSEFTPIETEEKFREVLLTSFAIDTHLFLRTEEELKKEFINIPFGNTLPGNKVFIAFLEKIPNFNGYISLTNIAAEEEEISITNTATYYFLPQGAAKTKLTNQRIEQHLDTFATSRNRNTIEKMLQMISL